MPHKHHPQKPHYVSLSEYPRDGGLTPEDVARLDAACEQGVAEIEASAADEDVRAARVAADLARTQAIAALVDQMNGPTWEEVSAAGKYNIAVRIIMAKPPTRDDLNLRHF